MDLSAILKMLSDRASRYSINLNGQIDLDLGKDPLYGGTALVYRGILRQDGAKIAVKTSRFGPPGDIDSLTRILREVHLWSKLRHENVVRMLGISTEFGATISIVSDWLEMGDAYTYVQNKENDPRPLLMDIANGLHYLHSHTLGPIFHGDLKGLNVLVSDDRRGLLSDFGYSALTKSTFSMAIDVPRGGSLPWMAPELLNDYSQSSGGDVWALGMTILELFTRLPPFHGKTHEVNIIHDLLQKKLPARPTEELTCFRMTNAWWNICSSCWNYEPLLRPTAAAIVQIIKKIMQETPIFPPPNVVMSSQRVPREIMWELNVDPATSKVFEGMMPKDIASSGLYRTSILPPTKKSTPPPYAIPFAPSGGIIPLPSNEQQYPIPPKIHYVPPVLSFDSPPGTPSSTYSTLSSASCGPPSPPFDIEGLSAKVISVLEDVQATQTMSKLFAFAGPAVW